MERYSIREVIEMAVQTERLGHEYYSGMAEKFSEDNEIKDLFDTLAKKERVHEKRFNELKEIMGEEEPEDWEEVSKYMRSYVESAFFLGKDKPMLHLQSIQNIQAAVGFAIGFEKETLLYYYGIRDAVKEKDMVDEIINEEKSHIMWLNSFKSRFIKGT